MLGSVLVCITVIGAVIYGMHVWKRYNALYMFYCFYGDITRAEERIANNKWQKRSRIDDVMLFNNLELMCQYAYYGIIDKEWIRDAFGETIKRTMEQIMAVYYPEKIKSEQYRHLKRIYESLYEVQKEATNVGSKEK